MLCVQNFANLPTEKGDCKADLATRAHFCGNIIATKSPAGNVQEGVNFAEVEHCSSKNEEYKSIKLQRNTKMQIYNITNMIAISYVQDGVNFAEVEQ